MPSPAATCPVRPSSFGGCLRSIVVDPQTTLNRRAAIDPSIYNVDGDSRCLVAGMAYDGNEAGQDGEQTLKGLETRGRGGGPLSRRRNHPAGNRLSPLGRETLAAMRSHHRPHSSGERKRTVCPSL